MKTLNRWLPLIAGLALIASASAGTLISIHTPVGAITLELDDADKPITVSNFLNYLNSGRYTNLFAHRLESNFVFQSGGFTLSGNQIADVVKDAPIANEFTADPRFSNTYGTIAMAKIGGDPDSATSGWFINLADNVFLDLSNGGFTVFGRVIEGFDTLQALQSDFGNGASGGSGIYDARSQLGSDFANLPLLAGSLDPANFIFTTVAIVPEPATITLLALAATLALWRRIRPKSTKL